MCMRMNEKFLENKSLKIGKDCKLLTEILYISLSESKASYLFIWKLQQLQRAQYNTANSELQDTLFKHSHHH